MNLFYLFSFLDGVVNRQDIDILVAISASLKINVVPVRNCHGDEFTGYDIRGRKCPTVGTDSL